MINDIFKAIELGELGVEIKVSSDSYNRLTKYDIELFSRKFVEWAKIGQQMQWVDGVPPVFRPDERKWIIFERLTPFTRATVYDTAVWLGGFYS
ncbi:MAG: hypothetical protein H6Q72_935 [Firmicutes bacterium]|nr:hypothetical protein [Bacillota bacterium]